MNCPLKTEGFYIKQHLNKSITTKKMKSTDKSERILESLTGLQKAGAPDFFYSRLTARMQNELLSKRKQIFILRPLFVTSALFAVFILNVFSIIKFNTLKEPETTVQSSNTATIESFVSAYNINTESVYE